MSAAEQREKAVLRARREEAERQRAELQTRQNEEAAVIARQQRERRPQQEQNRGLPRQNRNQPNRRPGQTQAGPRTEQNMGRPSGGSVIRKVDAQDSQPQSKWSHDQLRKGSNQPKRSAIRAAGWRTNSQAENNEATQRHNTSGQPSKPQATVAMPSFLKAASSAAKEEPKPSGWGTGFVERKPLEYGEQELQPEFLKESPINQEQEDLPQTKPAPAFGMGAATDSEHYKPTRPDTESIHDILNVDTRSVSPP